MRIFIPNDQYLTPGFQFMRFFVPVAVIMLSGCGDDESKQTSPNTTGGKFTGRKITGREPAGLSVEESTDALPEPPSLYKLVKEFDTEVFKNMGPLFEARKGNDCRMDKVRIGGTHGGIFELDEYSGNNEYNGNGMSRSALGANWLITLIRDNNPEAITSFVTEKLLIERMSNSEGGPARYSTVSFSGPVLSTEPPMKSSACLLGVYTLFVGEGDDNRLGRKYSPRNSPRKRLGGRRAARVIEALQRFHNSGFAHAGIAPNSILDMEGGIFFVEVGASTPFVDEYGNHVTDRTTRRTHFGNYLEQSPWHLETDVSWKYRSTRRDDMFRLAETLSILEGPRDSYKRWRLSEEELAKFKRDVGNMSEEVPKIFREFYQYTLTMEYDTIPDYAKWIKLFNEYEE
jgi:hypothetical protein